jgi:ketosteroid isomerase-like protein
MANPSNQFRFQWLIRLTILLMLAGSACESKKQANNTDEQEIRALREISNKAIADKDTSVLGSTWTEDYHIVSSRNAEVAGRKGNLARFAGEFSARPDVIYVRTTEQVDVFSQWNMAAESGTWVGRWTEPAREGNPVKVELQGRYFAKWHKVKGQWRIRAEIFVPLQCSGEPFCSQSPI